MKNEKGEIFTVLAIVSMAILGAIFIPNDVSKAIGIQNKQNKIVQKQIDTIELLKDRDGKPIRSEDGTYIVKRVTKIDESDKQQSVTLWERIRSLPALWLVLMIAGVFFPPIALVMGVINKGLKAGLKQIVAGLENAKKAMHPDSVTVLDTNLSKKMDTKIKTVVKKIKADKNFPV